MKFQWEPNAFGRSSIAAVPEQGDSAPGISELLIDHVVDTYDDDRFLAASALAFAPYVFTRFYANGAVSTTTAAAIERQHGGLQGRVQNVHFMRGAHYTLGETVMHLDTEPSRREQENQLGLRREFNLSVLRSDHYSGGIMSMGGMTVSSNAWLLASSRKGASCWYPYIAVAVLLAEGVTGGAIKIPTQDRDDPHFRYAAGVCDAVGLKLLGSG